MKKAFYFCPSCQEDIPTAALNRKMRHHCGANVKAIESAWESAYPGAGKMTATVWGITLVLIALFIWWKTLESPTPNLPPFTLDAVKLWFAGMR